MPYDDEQIAKIREEADRISVNKVIPRGTRQYSVIWNGMYQPPIGGAMHISYLGIIWFPKHFTAHQRLTETLIVIHKDRVNDPSPLVDPKGMPDNTMTTLFVCEPDRTLAGHYWAATRRDVHSIVQWVRKPFHRRKPSKQDIVRLHEAVDQMLEA